MAIKIVLAVVKRIFKYQLLREADKNYLTDFFLAKEGSSGGAGLLQMMIWRDWPLFMIKNFPFGKGTFQKLLSGFCPLRGGGCNPSFR